METLMTAIAGQVAGAILGRFLYALFAAMCLFSSFAMFEVGQNPGPQDPPAEISHGLSAVFLVLGLFCAWLFLKPSKRKKPDTDKHLTK